MQRPWGRNMPGGGVRTEQQPAGLEQTEVRGGLGLGKGLGFDFK